MRLTWRGAAYDIEFPPGHESAPMPFERVALFGPTSADHPFPRTRWIADMYAGGLAYVEAKGASAQEALDGLAALVPAPLSAGGVA